MATKKLTKTTTVTSKKSPAKATDRATATAQLLSFAEIFRTSWNKSVAPLHGAKLPAPLTKFGLGKELTLGTIALLTILILGSLVAFFFGNQLIYAFQKQTSAAIVNGETVSRSDLDRRLEQSYGSDTVQKMIDETLVLQQGAKEKVTVSQGDIDAKKKQIEQQIAPEKLDDALSSRNLSMSDLERQIRIQIILEKILGAQVSVSDADIQSYFDQNKDTLATEHNKKSAELNVDEVRGEITDAVRNQKISEKYQSWIADLRSKATIKTFL